MSKEIAEQPVPHMLIYACRNAVSVMRSVGLNDAQIACIIQDVRAETLNEEFRRLKYLIEQNPPHHHRWGEIMDAVKEGIERDG